MPNPTDLPAPLLAWWDAGHADLPWRRTKEPYAVWVAEIMLQQTQIAAVLPYYERWMARFPTVEALAAAHARRGVEGLGRVGLLQPGAQPPCRGANHRPMQHGGRLPGSVNELMKLPGIGRYTAGAIASIAFGVAAPAVDGNVIRVLSRFHRHRPGTSPSRPRAPRILGIWPRPPCPPIAPATSTRPSWNWGSRSARRKRRAASSAR